MNTSLRSGIAIKIEDIAEKLESITGSATLPISLFGGKLSIALFFAHYARYAKSEEAKLQVHSILEDIFETAPFKGMYFDISFGFSGLGWTLEQFNAIQLMETDTSEIFGEHDHELYQWMVYELSRCHYDYIKGGLGIFKYFLSKPRGGRADQWLEHGVELLDQISVKKNDHIFWYDYDFRNQKTDTTRVNIGVSHGVPSILSVLCSAYEQQIKRDKTFELIRGTANYLLSLFNEETAARSKFPSFDVLDTTEPGYSSLAWCYGDLGVCLSLYKANKILKDMHIDDVIKKTLLHAIKRRNIEQEGITDAALCHGSCGIAHIFNRFGTWYNDPNLKDTAAYWFAHSLKQYPFMVGTAGFQPENKKSFFGDGIGLLEGIAGMGLAYISYLNPELSSWDEALLIS